MQSETPLCEIVADQFAAVADGDVHLDDAATSHVDSCLRCQAEQAQYRRLMKAMHDLRAAPVPVDPSLEHEIMFALDHSQGRVRGIVSSRIAAAIGGLAAGAAAAAGVIAITVRQRRVGRLAS